MENNTENRESSGQNSEEFEQKFQQDLRRLQGIANVLREMGFRVIDDFITLESLRSRTADAGFPIVRDGADGIRVSYSERDYGVKVWFTNGFEDPQNPKRQEVVRRLQEEGLM